MFTLSLHFDHPGPEGEKNEFDSPSYGRKICDEFFPTNRDRIQFPEPKEYWGTAFYFCLHYNGGVFVIKLPQGMRINKGDYVRFEPGSIKISV